MVSSKPIKEVYWDHPDRQPNPLISIPEKVSKINNKQNQNEGFINNESQPSFSDFTRHKIKVNNSNNETFLNDTLKEKSKIFDQSKYEISKDIIRSLNNNRNTPVVPIKVDNTFNPKSRYKNLKEKVIKIDVNH